MQAFADIISPSSYDGSITLGVYKNSKQFLSQSASHFSWEKKFLLPSIHEALEEEETQTPDAQIF